MSPSGNRPAALIPTKPNWPLMSFRLGIVSLIFLSATAFYLLVDLGDIEGWVPAGARLVLQMFLGSISILSLMGTIFGIYYFKSKPTNKAGLVMCLISLATSILIVVKYQLL